MASPFGEKFLADLLPVLLYLLSRLLRLGLVEGTLEAGGRSGSIILLDMAPQIDNITNTYEQL
jgi:hypothetical protein